MLALVVDFEVEGKKRSIFENLTVKEFGEMIVELSKKYVLVYDGVISHGLGLGCDMHVVAVGLR